MRGRACEASKVGPSSVSSRSPFHLFVVGVSSPWDRLNSELMTFHNAMHMKHSMIAYGRPASMQLERQVQIWGTTGCIGTLADLNAFSCTVHVRE